MTSNFTVFSIALLALIGLGMLFYFKRNAMDDYFSESDSAPAEAGPKPAGIDPRHVAAVTAAILAATHGRGRVVGIEPHSAANFSEATQRWRVSAIIESAGRRLAPSWKR